MHATIAPHLMTDKAAPISTEGIRWRLPFQRGVRRDHVLVEQGVVSENERGHGLHHRHGAWEHTGVAAPAALDRRFLVDHAHRALLTHDGNRRLENHAEVDRLAIDPAPHAARAVDYGKPTFGSAVRTGFSTQRSRRLIPLPTYGREG